MGGWRVIYTTRSKSWTRDSRSDGRSFGQSVWSVRLLSVCLSVCLSVFCHSVMLVTRPLLKVIDILFISDFLGWTCCWFTAEHVSPQWELLVHLRPLRRTTLLLKQSISLQPKLYGDPSQIMLFRELLSMSATVGFCYMYKEHTQRQFLFIG